MRNLLPNLLLALALMGCTPSGGSAGFLAGGRAPGGPPASLSPGAVRVLGGSQQLTAPRAAGAATAEGVASTPNGDVLKKEATAAAVEIAHPELLTNCQDPRRIVIEKGARSLELRCGESLAARYIISLGFAPAGNKHHEGDGRTPEGEYFITNKFFSPYHRSLQLSYPNNNDADRGLAEGQITEAQHRKTHWANDHCQPPPQNTGLGSFLQIHGSGGGPDVGDWTLGCVAVDNPEIEAVFAFHQSGCGADGKPRTPVLVLP